MCETLDMAARASPRKPSVPMASSPRSSASLLVAWRRKATPASSGDMPQPSSVTRIELGAASGELHRYVPGPGVDGVLDELLNRRRGPFHNLPAGDEVRNVRGEYVYPGHPHTSFAFS